MHQEAVTEAIADELRQQQALYGQILQAWRVHPGPTSREECEQAIEGAYWQGMASRVRGLDPVAITHRCYTVYQSCVYDAMAREQEFELAPNRLVLKGKPESNHFEVRLRSNQHTLSTDPALITYQNHTRDYQVNQRFIQLDRAIEAYLSQTLAQERQLYRELSPDAFHHDAHRIGATCVTEIGKIILGALRTMLPAYAAFLGTLQWHGADVEVAIIPSGRLSDTLEMAAMRRARARQR